METCFLWRQVPNRAVADPTLQRRPAAAGELYIPQDSWPFSSSFLHCSHAYIFLFNTSIASVGTHERLQESACQKVQYLSFYGTLKIAKIGFRMSFFLSSHISVPPIFKHFLIELEF